MIEQASQELNFELYGIPFGRSFFNFQAQGMVVFVTKQYGSKETSYGELDEHRVSSSKTSLKCRSC